MQKTILATLLGLALAGCATPHLTYQGMQNTTQERVGTVVQQVTATPAKPASVREIDEPYVDFKRVETTRKRGDISIKAAGTAFAPLMSEVAKKAGYSVVFADNVEVTKKVTVEYNSANAEDVLRSTAFLAGYVAVIDKERRIITVADTATYTFKIPSGVLSNLGANYSVGGNPANAGGGSSGGGSSGGGGGSSGGGGGTSLKAEFTVSGKDSSAGQSIQKLITDVAGGNAQVTVSDLGFLSVRANAQSLRRVHEFLKKLSADAMTQVDMEASVVEVSLSKEFSLGIQWGKVAQTAMGGTGVGTNVSGGLANAVNGLIGGTSTPGQTVSALVSASAEANGLSAFRLGASTASIINALQSYSDVKIVSQPRLFSMNNTPATFFDGTQIPYLGSVTTTAATVAGAAPTVSGTTSFAINGLSFSVIPSVVDNNRVQITLIPVISKVGEFQTFSLGSSGTLKVPTQTNQQTYMRVLAESGKTLVIGGIRQGSDTKSTSVLASTGNSSNTRELVILLRANVIPAPEFDPVVAEAI